MDMSSKYSKLLIGVLILFSFSCNNEITPLNDKKTSGINSSSDITSSKTDEDIINELINNNNEFFPLDLNGDDDALEATVPNNGGVVFATVPNNGGVVFATDDSFNTKGILDNLKNTTDTLSDNVKTVTDLKEKISNIKERVKTILPQKWGRKLVGNPKREIQTILNKEKNRAEVTVKTTIAREIISNRLNRKLIKKVSEISVRKAIFEKEGKKWNLSEVSPFEFKTNNDKSDLIIESIKLKAEKDNQTKIFEISPDKLTSKSSIPEISKGDILTFEVKAINKDESFDPPLYAYVRLPGLKLRIPMFDDGNQENLNPLKTGKKLQSGDLVKGDNIYTANIIIKNKIGLHNITFDIISGGSFENDLDNYDSISKSVPIIIKN